MFGAAARRPLPFARCPLRPLPARNASASSARGSATHRACARCSPPPSTSPACGCRGAAAWWSEAARWGSRRSRACSPATARSPWSLREAGARARRLRARGLDPLGAARVPRLRPGREVRGDRGRRRDGGQHLRLRGGGAAGDALQRRRRAAALQLHPAGDRAQRPAGDRDLHLRRLPGARQAAEARDRGGVRRALCAPRGDPQRGPGLGQGHASHLPGPQGVLRGDRQRRARPGGAGPGGPRGRARGA